MTSQNKVKTITLAGLLCAIGIVIPMYSPFRLIIEPASFTLASHVAIIIAMFISPTVGIFVAFGTALGFLSTFPLVVVLRALSHIVFIAIGAYLLKKNNNILLSLKTMIPFAVFISIIHALCEVAVSLTFYSIKSPGSIVWNTIIYLVGFGTIVHSLVDFTIAYLLWRPLQYVLNVPANAKIKANRPSSIKIN